MGADKQHRRVCVPYTPTKGACGDGGQPACKGVPRILCHGSAESLLTSLLVTLKTLPEDGDMFHVLDSHVMHAGREFECNFGFVGADKEGGRVCVPYKGRKLMSGSSS